MRPVSRSGTLAVSLAALAVFWLGCGGGGADLAGPALGSLDITTATSGPEPDADGYAVSIDDAAPEAIGTATTRRLEGLATGAHTVALSGVAANCTVASGSRQSVNVTANAVTAANFAVTCAPTTGAIQVTTSAGTPADPDGYQLLLDGVAALPIGTNASVTLPDLAPGSHAVGLGGLAADCRVDGDNPRTVPVVAGDTTAVGLAVSCTPAPPGAGTLEVTTRTDGTDQDADGYSFTLDGGPSQPIGLAATTSIANLPAGTHAVQLLGVAANCTLAGPAQQSVQVPGGGTAEVVFSITCDTRPASTGALELTIAGLPDGTNAAVTVTGPGGYTQQLTATRTLADLQPGSYTVAAAEVTSGGARYTATPASRNVAITAGGTKQAMVTYAAVTTPSVNLRIDGWYLTQSTQSASGDIPLVTNRDAYLRVFVVSDGTNTAAPGVRVRLYRSGSLTRTLDIPSPAASTPTKRDEGRLASSWNVKIPRELITPGLAVVAEVDPDNAIPEKNEADNNYPASGTPQPQTVRDAPVFGITFVPIMQKANGLAGDVSDANRSTYLELSRRMHPLPGAEGSVHAVYTTTTEDPLEPDDANGAWSTVLSEINALRISEGTDHTYYGVVHIGYASGVAGLGYIGAPAAMGYDRDFDRSRVMAHELGHTWGRLHSPCGNPPGADPNYPYSGGTIGVYGLDQRNEILKDPSFPDIMGYCGDPWISDYTYRGIVDFRSGARAMAAASVREERCLLVWGRIVDGRAVLEPAFELVTRPSLPKTRGPYTVEGVTADGMRVFELSFAAVEVADDPRGARHFAFAVPIGESAAARLGSLRLIGPAGAAAADRVPPPVAAARTPEPVEARRVGGGIALRWDAAASPMIMVRDPETGEVLSFARGGQAEVATGRTELDLSVSDRVGSRRVRVAVRP
jgi:hypothetical protein